MKRRLGTRCAQVVAAAVLLAPLWGCTPWPFVTSQAISFGLGWLARDLGLASGTETSCYRNGIRVDCSELPSGLQPVQP